MDEKNLPLPKQDRQKLPSVEDLYADAPDLAWKNEQLNALLNAAPKAEWVKQHPTIKVKYKDEKGQEQSFPYRYLPIDRIEYLLLRIFQRYRIEITAQGTAFNACWVTVRVHYFNPVIMDFDYHDGIGAMHLQTKAGASPADMVNINHGAVMMAMPHAKTLAVKDACDHLGKLFGRDLNNIEAIGFTMDVSLNKEDQLTQLKELFKLKKKFLQRVDVESVERIISTKETRSYKKTIKKLSEL